MFNLRGVQPFRSEPGEGGLTSVSGLGDGVTYYGCRPVRDLRACRRLGDSGRGRGRVQRQESRDRTQASGQVFLPALSAPENGNRAPQLEHNVEARSPGAREKKVGK